MHPNPLYIARFFCTPTFFISSYHSIDSCHAFGRPTQILDSTCGHLRQTRLIIAKMVVTTVRDGSILGSQIIGDVSFGRTRPARCLHLSRGLRHQTSLPLCCRSRLRLVNMVQFICVCGLSLVGGILASLRIWNVLISAGALRNPRTS